MQAFHLIEPSGIDAAVAAGGDLDTQFIAGGTDLMQLMKDNVETPGRLVDLERLPLAEIGPEGNALRLGAMARMSTVAEHPMVRQHFPMISQALLASASPQIRNMGTMGGNLLQRTRCGYFRDTGFACNKRVPGSGCPAIHGENRMLAILGTSPHCIASHPSDLAVAFVALDAVVEVHGPRGMRSLPVRDFHRSPGDAPQRDTNLQPGELITAVIVPYSAAAQRSYYLKVRDRASFEFALVSAAVGLDLRNGVIRDARVAAGGVGTRPWHLPEVEAALIGQQLNEAVLRAAAMRAGEGAQTFSQNAFKLTLLRRSVLRALQIVSA